MIIVESLNFMKSEEPEILYSYALEKNLLPEWTDEYATDAQLNWFEKAQDYACELKLLYHQADLKEKLHSIYKKKWIDGDMESANALSQAFNKALDFRKHATQIRLPDNLIALLPKHLHQYVVNDQCE